MSSNTAVTYMLHEGDCLEWLRSLPSDSVDSCVTDPPYGLSAEPDPAAVLSAWLKGEEFHHKSRGFMSKSWDSMVPGPTVWKEIHRVLKPGGMLLAFAGTRTWDLMSMAIRLAGFENRDTVRRDFGVPATSWSHGQGFPKGKSQFKPAWEPILVFRKPGPLREYRIDECRVAGNVQSAAGSVGFGASRDDNYELGEGRKYQTSGRWPANAVFSHTDFCVRMCANGSDVADWRCAEGCPVAELDLQSGVSKSTGGGGLHLAGEDTKHGIYGQFGERNLPPNVGKGDVGTAARFYHQFSHDPTDPHLDLPTFIYQAKASRSERERGCEGINDVGRGNTHVSVKPLQLMRHLCRLVTPVGGTVIDPFAGSGTTGCAAMLEGLSFLGAEREPEYVAIARARIGYYFAQSNGVSDGVAARTLAPAAPL